MQDPTPQQRLAALVDETPTDGTKLVTYFAVLSLAPRDCTDEDLARLADTVEKIPAEYRAPALGMAALLRALRPPPAPAPRAPKLPLKVRR